MKRSSPYNIADVMLKHHVSLEEATEMVRVQKLKTSMSLIGFKYRYGEEEGTRRYEEKCKKDAFRNTLAGKIELFGEEEGRRRYEKQNKNNAVASSLVGKVEKYGLDEGVARHKIMNDMRSQNGTKESLINKFGIEYASVVSEKRALSKKVLTERYGLDIANQIINDRLVYFLDPVKYLVKNKNFNELDAKIKVYRDATRDKESTDAEIVTRLQDIQDMKNCNIRGAAASAASLFYFMPFKNFLLNEDLNCNDIMVGDGVSKELKLVEDGRLFFYDFTIESLKIIIEFDGVAFHPRHDLSPDEMAAWSNPYGVSGWVVFSNDKHKEMIAQKNGYKIYRVREDDKNIMEKLKGIYYENKKN